MSPSSDIPINKALNKTIDIKAFYYGKISDFEAKRIRLQTVKLFVMGYNSA